MLLPAGVMDEMEVQFHLIGRSLVLSQMVSLEFFIDITLPIALELWVHSASNRNEYQEDFLGVNAAGA
jgi:hypothetical protein